MSLFKEFPVHSDELGGIDVSSDHSLLFTCSKDATAKVIKIESGQVLKTLSFAEKAGEPNLVYKGLRFHDDHLYTLSTQIRTKSYLTKYSVKTLQPV